MFCSDFDDVQTAIYVAVVKPASERGRTYNRVETLRTITLILCIVYVFTTINTCVLNSKSAFNFVYRIWCI